MSTCVKQDLTCCLQAKTAASHPKAQFCPVVSPNALPPCISACCCCSDRNCLCLLPLADSAVLLSPFGISLPVADAAVHTSEGEFSRTARGLHRDAKSFPCLFSLSFHPRSSCCLLWAFFFFMFSSPFAGLRLQKQIHVAAHCWCWAPWP